MFGLSMLTSFALVDHSLGDGGSGCGLNPRIDAGLVNATNCVRPFALLMTSTLITAESYGIAFVSPMGGGWTVTTGRT